MYANYGPLLIGVSERAAEHRNQRYVQKKRMKINAEKSMVMGFGKFAEKWKKMKIKVTGERIAEVRKSSYLRYATLDMQFT